VRAVIVPLRNGGSERGRGDEQQMLLRTLHVIVVPHGVLVALDHAGDVEKVPCEARCMCGRARNGKNVALRQLRAPLESVGAPRALFGQSPTAIVRVDGVRVEERVVAAIVPALAAREKIGAESGGQRRRTVVSCPRAGAPPALATRPQLLAARPHILNPAPRTKFW
jgi:hypothetical protein